MKFVNCIVKVFVLLLVQVQFLEAHTFQSSLPPYIEKCSKSDPNFHQCCLQHAKEAMPHILKGDKKYGIVNFLPLFIPSLTVDAGRDLKISIKDIHLYGLEGVDLKDVNIDLNNQHVHVELSIPKLELSGKYNVDGKILILPIKGNGDINITAIRGTYNYDFSFNLQTVNGLEYPVINDDKVTFDLQDAHFNLENLFDGDSNLGAQMNKFLNENWKEVLKELGGAINETIRTIARTILMGYFQRIPYSEFVLP